MVWAVFFPACERLVIFLRIYVVLISSEVLLLWSFLIIFCLHYGEIVAVNSIFDSWCAISHNSYDILPPLRYLLALIIHISITPLLCII